MNKKEKNIGIVMGIGSYLSWGSLVIYWKMLSDIHPVLIMCYRMVMSFLLLLAICLIFYRKDQILAPIREKGAISKIAWCSLVIALNWTLYIWAVSSNHIVEASMGYFINPLLSVFLGIFFFHEKLKRAHVIAIGLAFVGVIIMIVQYQRIPFIALSLATSFALYGVLKKKLGMNAVFSLFYETALLIPLAIPAILVVESMGRGIIGNATPLQYGLIIMSGIVTAVPLMLFAASTNRIQMTTMGFLQYISPTMTLLLGVFLYHESFGQDRLIPFLFIWAGLAIFTISSFLKKATPAGPESD